MNLLDERKNQLEALDKDGTHFRLVEGELVYYIDICSGTVAAVLEHPACKFQKERTKVFELLKKNGFVKQDCFSEIFAPIRAKAICAEEDEFDVNVGIKIAKRKCLAKYYKKVTQYFVNLNNELEDILSYIEDRCLENAELFEKFSN